MSVRLLFIYNRCNMRIRRISYPYQVFLTGMVILFLASACSVDRQVVPTVINPMPAAVSAAVETGIPPQATGTVESSKPDSPAPTADPAPDSSAGYSHENSSGC